MRPLTFTSVLFLLIFCCSCNEKNTCLTKSTYNTKHKINPFISFVSEVNSKNGCEYIIKSEIRLKNWFCDSAILYQRKQKFYMRLLHSIAKPLSEDFLIFDLTKEPGFSDTITIIYKDITSYKDTFLFDKIQKVKYAYTIQNKFKTSNFGIVYMFQFKNFFFNYWDGEIVDKLDVVFFVTEKHGVVGSYVYVEENNENIYIAPAGNIFEEYLDYSNMAERVLE